MLEVLRALSAEARRDPSLLRRPVRVVVPSRSLRQHLCERIATELGATVGVEVQTLFGAAIEVLERAGARAGGGDALVEVLARRAAAAEPALRAACAPFRDGYRAAAAGVRDLLDAGLTQELVEPAAECLAETRVSDAELRRAQAVVRAAGAVAGELRARDFAGRPLLLARAREVYLEAPETRWSARAVLVHGFADVTGRGADLIEALVCGAARAGAPALVVVDRPPEPARAAPSGADGARRGEDEVAPRAGAPVEDRGAAFTGRFLERLASAAGRPRPPLGAPAPPRVELLRAPGSVAEVREVARRLRTALAGGARPERCAVVARDLKPYRAALRTHFARLGVPHSALRARAPMDGPARRLLALLELLEEGPAAAMDRWLDAVRGYVHADGGWRPPSEELRLGLRGLGGLSLAEVGALTLPADAPDRLPLPLRRGVGRISDGPERAGDRGRDDGRFAAFRQKLAKAEVESARGRAQLALGRLERWPGRATVARHLAALDELCSAALGWRAADPETRRLVAATAELREDLAAEVLERDEVLGLLARSVPQGAGGPLGGEGGGVQVLEVMEARARTFEHLFVLGLNRDAFPRTPREDPLLGDDLRRALTALLPEIPVKARARDEERYLFAQLVEAAPRVTLSWQVADEDGRARVLSPLLVGLLGEGGERAIPQVAGPRELAEPGPHTAHEAAVRGGLEHRTHGHRERLESALTEAALTGPGRAGAGRAGDDAAALASARARVLEAFERGPFEPRALAPWLGFLGRQGEAGIRPDPRTEPFYVTRLEGLARCPWQTILTRYLRLERPPDPVEELPTVDARSVGNVVHTVLERVATAAGVPEGLPLGEALEGAGREVPWPDAGTLEGYLEQAARRELERERKPLDGHVRLLAACARELTLRAAEFLGAEARRFEDARVLGVELVGSARVAHADGSVRIDFKADRVERREGRLVLSDYKTGKPKTQAEFAHQLAAGLALQPATYALAAAELERGAGPGAPKPKGRYLFFQAEPEGTEVGPGLGLGPHREAFERAVHTLVGAWTAGTFFPRMVEPGGKSAQACLTCEVTAACLLGDSGARRAVLGLGLEAGDAEGDASGRGGAFAPEAGALFRLHPQAIKAAAKAAKRERGS